MSEKTINKVIHARLDIEDKVYGFEKTPVKSKKALTFDQKVV